MSAHRVTTYREGFETTVRVISIPELDGSGARGFVLADDRSWCVVLEPLTGEPNAG